MAKLKDKIENAVNETRILVPGSSSAVRGSGYALWKRQQVHDRSLTS